jgi:hypothetical protein
MKTSKIIFISLLGTIAFIILAAFVDIRINGHRNGINPADIKIKKLSVPSFRVLCVNSSTIDLIQNTSSSIEVTLIKDTMSPYLNYTIKDDTLTVSVLKHNVSVKIYSTDSLRRILLKNSNMTIDRIVSEKMSFDMDSSSVWFNHGKSFFHTLNIMAKNHSEVSTTKFKVDSLRIILQKSEANFETIVKVLSGSLSDSSKIYALQPEEILLKKDSTSKVSVNEY